MNNYIPSQKTLIKASSMAASNALVASTLTGYDIKAVMISTAIGFTASLIAGTAASNIISTRRDNRIISSNLHTITRIVSTVLSQAISLALLSDATFSKAITHSATAFLGTIVIASVFTIIIVLAKRQMAASSPSSNTNSELP